MRFWTERSRYYLILITLIVVIAFNLTNAGLGGWALQRAGVDFFSAAQLLSGVGGAAAGVWSVVLLKRQS
jgi:hypothetical protein